MPETAESASKSTRRIKPVDWSGLQPLLESGGISIKVKDPSSGQMEDADQFEHVVFKTPEVEPASFIGRCYARIRQIRKELESLKEPDGRNQKIREIAEFLSYPNPLLREAVTKVLAKLGEEGVDALRRQIADAPDDLCAASLLALGAIEHRRLKGDSTESAIVAGRRLEGGSPVVREAAVRALRYIGTELCQEMLLEKLDDPVASERPSVIRELSAFNSALVKGHLFFQTVGLKGPSLEIHEIPQEAALFLRAADIAGKISEPVMRKIALRFGYIDEALFKRLESTGEAADLRTTSELIETVGVATADMVDGIGPMREGNLILRKWQDRKQAFQWAFLGDEYVTTREPVSIELGDSVEARVDRAILFAALREDDLCNLDEQREPKPFDREHEEKAPGAFFCLSFNGFQRFYMQPAVEVSQKVLSRCSPEVAAKLQPFAVFENLACSTHNDPERLKESELVWLAKWQFADRFVEEAGDGLSINQEIFTGADEKLSKVYDSLSKSGFSLRRTVFELERSANHNLWRFLVSPSAVEAKASDIIYSAEALKGYELLSSGAVSFLKLLARINPDILTDESSRNELIDGILHRETRLKKYLPSIGLELQNDRTEENETWAWKSLLDACGIPSPRRPEYLSMVEAAFNPAWDAEVLAKAAGGLLSLGFCKDLRRGMAAHITLGGEFGSEAKFLALGLMGLCPEMPSSECSRELWLRSLGGLMSKGMLYRKIRNEKEALSAPSITDKAPQIALEIRVLTLQNSNGSLEEAQEMIMKALPAAQHMAGALRAWKKEKAGGKLDETEQNLTGIWQEYQSQLQELYGSGPVAETGIITADWYGSTGDSRDRELTSELEIVLALERFMKIQNDSEKWLPIKDKTRELVFSTVQKVRAAIGD